MKDLRFNHFFNSSLLFYSWNQLKSSSFFGYHLSYKNKFPSFSDSWFQKTAFLIKKGSFVYNKRNTLRFAKYKQKNYFISILGQMIIELAFINIITHFKEKSLNFNLNKCLRWLKGSLLIFFYCYNCIKAC
jgi:hypothetical protein